MSMTDAQIVRVRLDQLDHHASRNRFLTPGYKQEVLDAAVEVTATHARLTGAAYKRLWEKYRPLESLPALNTLREQVGALADELLEEVDP